MKTTESTSRKTETLIYLNAQLQRAQRALANPRASMTSGPNGGKAQKIASAQRRIEKLQQSIKRVEETW